MSFETVYNVEMTCDSCVDSVKQALGQLSGVTKFDINLAKQRVAVEGVVAPSSIIKAIQTTGRDAIIRGTGNPNSAAVAILESFDPADNAAPVKGLARIVATNENKLLVDITLNGLAKGTYQPLFKTSGNISQGAASTGSTYYKLPTVTVEEPSDEPGLYAGQRFVSVPLSIAELIGRAFVVEPGSDSGASAGAASGALAGVVARSAGVWENDKHVCSCSGKTVWQERQDAKLHGITV